MLLFLGVKIGPNLPPSLHVGNGRFHTLRCLICGPGIPSISLSGVQYPSPLHGYRWITRPGLAQLTEWCRLPLRIHPCYRIQMDFSWLSPNTLDMEWAPVPSSTMEDSAGEGGWEGWGETGGLMWRRELPLSPGETRMATVRLSADRGIRSFRNSSQPHTPILLLPLHPNPPSPYTRTTTLPLLVLHPYRGRLEEARRQADMDTHIL